MSGLPSITIPEMVCALGLEPDMPTYIAHLVHVFRLIRPALTKSATVWLNLGDTYAGDNKTGGSSLNRKKPSTNKGAIAGGYPRTKRFKSYLPNKNLLGIPWRIAFALQADDWILCLDVVWNKANGKPESVRCRPTKSHEYVFMFANTNRNYYDLEAIALPVKVGYKGSMFTDGKNALLYPDTGQGPRNEQKKTKNRRSVWRIGTARFTGSHFAVMPEKLVERCIKASSRPGDIVLDPFCGSGTVQKVATELSRNSIGIELNKEYYKLIQKRLNGVQLPLIA